MTDHKNTPEMTLSLRFGQEPDGLPEQILALYRVFTDDSDTPDLLGDDLLAGQIIRLIKDLALLYGDTFRSPETLYLDTSDLEFLRNFVFFTMGENIFEPSINAVDIELIARKLKDGSRERAKELADMLDAYAYEVRWSEEKREYIGTCAEIPHLSHLETIPELALLGIKKLVRSAVIDMELAGESLPDAGKEDRQDSVP